MFLLFLAMNRYVVVMTITRVIITNLEIPLLEDHLSSTSYLRCLSFSGLAITHLSTMCCCSLVTDTTEIDMYESNDKLHATVDDDVARCSGNKNHGQLLFSGEKLSQRYILSFSEKETGE
jgi:hypothetical protein